MRRFFIVLFSSIFGSIGLFALYVVWHPNPNDISPEVDAISYRAMFNATVLKRTGKEFTSLDDAGKLKALNDLISSPNETDPVREVALFEIRNIANKDAAFEVVHKNLANLHPDLYEVGVASVAALGTPKTQAYLDKLYSSLYTDPFAHTPIGGYRTGSFLISGDGSSGDLRFSFTERSRNEADYSLSKAREIALFLPANPSHVLAFPNFDDVLERFNNSMFVKTLNNSPVGQDAWTLPLLRSIASLRERLTRDVGFMATYFSPERLFRDHLIIGNYNGEILMASFKDKNASVAETLMGIFEKLGKDFGVQRWQQNGVTIATVVNKKTKKTLSYATIEKYFLVSTDTALIARSVRTFTTDRGASVAVDPLFNNAYGAIDMTGAKDYVFAWINPTEYFAVEGSNMPAARRLAILARTLNKPLNAPAPDGTILGTIRGVIGTARFGGEDGSLFWRYITGVRTLGKKSVDSLKRITGVDFGKQIMPYISSTTAIAYGGTSYMSEGNGYSNTGFNVVFAVPLVNAPANFEQTVLTFFKRSTRLTYMKEAAPDGAVWIAKDTTLSSDSVIRARALQPSFAIRRNTLYIASTPDMLHNALSAGAPPMTDNSPYMSGNVRIDSFAVDAERYLRPYLKNTDKYTPEEISSRLEPMRKALSLYDRLSWTVTVGSNGLRRGEGTLSFKR